MHISRSLSSNYIYADCVNICNQLNCIHAWATYISQIFDTPAPCNFGPRNLFCMHASDHALHLSLYISRAAYIKLMQYHMHDTMFISFCPKSAWPGSSTFARLVMQLSLDELCERFYWTCRWRLQPFAWQKRQG